MKPVLSELLPDSEAQKIAEELSGMFQGVQLSEAGRHRLNQLPSRQQIQVMNILHRLSTKGGN